MNITVISQFLFFLYIAMCLFCVCDYQHENDGRKKRSDYCSNQTYYQNIALCQKAKLTIRPITDSDKKSITVSFTFTKDVDLFKDCFMFYDIFLRDESGNFTKGYKLYAGSFVRKNYSHTFEGVLPGSYKIEIQPCYTYECCANLSIPYEDLINITSYDFLSNTLEIPTDNSIIVQVIIGVAVALILIFVALYYFCSNLKKYNGTETDSVNEDSVPVKCAIYLFHYYDDFGVNKQKVDVLKNFLIHTSLYDSVKTIEDELSRSLCNVNSWLKSVLKERTEDGKIQKIILIDSNDEDEEGAIENLIFNDFLLKLNNNTIQCLSSYDNIFVVQITGILGSSDKLKDIVNRHRFRLPKHLDELCLNLSSMPDTNILPVKKHLQEIIMRHPVKNLGTIGSA